MDGLSSADMIENWSREFAALCRSNHNSSLLHPSPPTLPRSALRLCLGECSVKPEVEAEERRWAINNDQADKWQHHTAVAVASWSEIDAADKQLLHGTE